MTTAAVNAYETWNVTNDEYHAAPNVFGSSQVRDVMRDPAEFAARHIFRTTPQKRTGALDFGSAFDAALLDPDAFDASVLIGPTKTRGVKWEAFEAEHPGKLIITQEERDSIELMAAAVYANPIARDLLAQTDGLRYNHRVRGIDPSTGLALKAEFDLHQTKARWVANVKTTARRKGRPMTYPAAFRRTMAEFGYWDQTAHHLTAAIGYHGGEDVQHFHIVVDKSPRAGALHESCAVYLTNNPASEYSLERLCEAMDRRARALEGIKHGIDTGDWPATLYQIQSL